MAAQVQHLLFLNGREDELTFDYEGISLPIAKSVIASRTNLNVGCVSTMIKARMMKMKNFELDLRKEIDSHEKAYFLVSFSFMSSEINKELVLISPISPFSFSNADF